MSLVLRRRADGAISVVGDTPVEHIFATSFIQRGLEGGYVHVTVTVDTDDGGTDYELSGIGDEDGTPNATSWRCVKRLADSASAGRKTASKTAHG